MTEILLATAVFTGLVMMLALIVLGARTMIWGRGRVRLNINAERTIESEVGEKLLDVLNQGGVVLPTSCGGAGTCGLCRVQIAGAAVADALPIERAQMSAADIADGYRLACQLVVRGPLDITVPSDLLGAETWRCRVKETRTLSPLIKEITLALPAGAERSFAAGCYMLINTPTFKLAFADIDVLPAHSDAWQQLGLRHLKVESPMEQTRAYSLVNRPDVHDALVFNIRLALPPTANPDAPPGVVSSYLFGLHVDDEISVAGPYGDFFVQDTDREIVLIGGGVGMAPLYAHVYDQLERRNTPRTVQYWYGARGIADLYYTDQMEALARTHENFSWHPVLSDPGPQDAWDGDTGFVHEAVRQHLSTHPDPKNCEYYLCGPPLMIQAVRAMLDTLGVAPDHIFSDDFGA